MSVLTDLVSCWELNEASGTRNDAHGTNHLTDNNTVSSATGKVGNCADFEVTSAEYLSIADNASVSLSGADVSFMLCAWVQLESAAATMEIIAKWDSPGAQREYLLDWESGTNRFRFGVSGNGTASTVVSANNFGNASIATWYYVIGWHDAAANTVNIQINNGTPDSAAHTGGTHATGTTALFIGAASFAGPSNHWDGLIDQVLFYKGSFPDADTRTWLYNSGNGRSYPDMVAAVNPTAALTGNLSNVAVASLSSLAEFPLTSNLSNVTVGTVVGSVPSEATATLNGVSCTASVGNVVGVTILPVTVGEYRHVAASPIAQRRPMRLKDLERIYKQMERKR